MEIKKRPKWAASVLSDVILAERFFQKGEKSSFMIWLFQRFTKDILAFNFDIGRYEEVGGRKNKKINWRGKKQEIHGSFFVYYIFFIACAICSYHPH